MTNPADATEVVPYLTSAATIVFAQKWLKGLDKYQQFVKAVPVADRWVHWLVAGVASLVAAEGIHLTYNWTAATGGQFIFTVPSLITLLHGVADWFKVYILQHTVYEATTHPTTPTPTA